MNKQTMKIIIQSLVDRIQNDKTILHVVMDERDQYQDALLETEQELNRVMTELEELRRATDVPNNVPPCNASKGLPEGGTVLCEYARGHEGSHLAYDSNDHEVRWPNIHLGETAMIKGFPEIDPPNDPEVETPDEPDVETSDPVITPKEDDPDSGDKPEDDHANARCESWTKINGRRYLCTRRMGHTKTTRHTSSGFAWTDADAIKRCESKFRVPNLIDTFQQCSDEQGHIGRHSGGGYVWERGEPERKPLCGALPPRFDRVRCGLDMGHEGNHAGMNYTWNAS